MRGPRPATSTTVSEGKVNVRSQPTSCCKCLCCLFARQVTAHSVMRGKCYKAAEDGVLPAHMVPSNALCNDRPAVQPQNFVLIRLGRWERGWEPGQGRSGVALAGRHALVVGRPQVGRVDFTLAIGRNHQDGGAPGCLWPPAAGKNGGGQLPQQLSVVSRNCRCHPPQSTTLQVQVLHLQNRESFCRVLSSPGAARPAPASAPGGLS